jgi:serine/threonine protein kinase
VTSSYRSSPLLSPGTTIAGYRVDAVIGHGGMGVVYEATQLSLKRTIALKLLASHLSDDPRFRERFRREGELQARLDHPHIVTVHEAGESEHGLFLAMRLVRGPRLKDLILSRELNAERTVRLLGPIAEALDVAHEEGLIHRDVKPQNILIGNRDHAFLADFGLTKLPGEKSLTGTGQFVGTLDYVAPEQIVGERASARTDVYAFGAVLCECLTGGVPFLRDNEAAVLYAHLSDEPPRLSEREPLLPAAIDDVVARALAKEPDDRYASAGELMDDLEEALGGTRLRAIRQPKPIVTGAQRESSERTEILRPDEPTAPISEAQPDAPGRKGPSLLPLAALVAAGAVAGGAAGALTAGSDDGARVESRSASFALPTGWTQREGVKPPSGLKLRDVAAATDGRHTILAGLQSAPEQTLLPRAFKQTVTNGPLGAGELVTIGRLEAQRHRGVVLKGSGDRLTIYTVPTSEGVVTVTCRSPKGTPAGDGCERAAATLKLRRGEPFALTPSSAYGRAVDGVVASVQPRRRSLRQRLGKATTRLQQQQAAGGLAQVFDAAARRAAQLEPPPPAVPANQALSAALHEAATAYRHLRNTAANFDRTGYERAKREVRAAEARVQGSLDALRQLGYTIL